MQGARPRVFVGVLVDRNIEEREIAEGQIPVCRIDAPASDAGLQTVRNLEPPDRRDPSA